MQKNHGRSFKIILRVSFILLMLLLGAPAVLAQSGARLYLQPVSSANGVLTVEVMAENVADLYGLEIHLKYNSAILEPQDVKADQEGVQVEPGQLLPVDRGFVVANQADPAEGKITYAITLLNPAPPVNGNGSVARVSFNVLQNVSSTIEIERAQLVAFDLKTIPVELTPFTVDAGSPEPAVVVPAAMAAAAAPSTFPWWIVAALVIMLGLAALSAFLLLGHNRPRRTATSPQPTQPESTRLAGSGRRPSAFK